MKIEEMLNKVICADNCCRLWQGWQNSCRAAIKGK